MLPNLPNSPNTIRLLSCSNLESAKDLAEALGRPVVASKGKVSIYENGFIESTQGNKWFEIQPNGSQKNVDAPKGNKSGKSVRLGGKQVNGVDVIEEVNGRKNPTADFAGQQVTTKNGLHNINIKDNGFADFTDDAVVSIDITSNGNVMKGDHYLDFKEANKLAGLGDSADAHLKYEVVENGITIKPYVDYTWHHHEDTKTMQLIPKTLNNPTKGGISHTGGAAIVEHNKKNPNDILDLPSPSHFNNKK